MAEELARLEKEGAKQDGVNEGLDKSMITEVLAATNVPLEILRAEKRKK